MQIPGFVDEFLGPDLEGKDLPAFQQASGAIDEFEECYDAFAGAGLAHGLNVRVAHRGVDGAVARMTLRNQPLHGNITKAAGWHIGDAEEPDVVMRIQKQFQVSQQVFDFAPVEESLSSDQVVTNGCLA